MLDFPHQHGGLTVSEDIVEDDPSVAVVLGTSVDVASNAVVRAVPAQVAGVDALRHAVAVEVQGGRAYVRRRPTSVFAAVQQPHLLSRVRATSLLQTAPQVQLSGEIAVPVPGEAGGHNGPAKRHIALHDADVVAAYERNIADDSSMHFDAVELMHIPLGGSNELDSDPQAGPDVVQRNLDPFQVQLLQIAPLRNRQVQAIELPFPDSSLLQETSCCRRYH
jgi:hypothetical protein